MTLQIVHSLKPPHWDFSPAARRGEGMTHPAPASPAEGPDFSQGAFGQRPRVTDKRVGLD